jgi:hypothetical protein
MGGDRCGHWYWVEGWLWQQWVPWQHGTNAAGGANTAAADGEGAEIEGAEEVPWLGKGGGGKGGVPGADIAGGKGGGAAAYGPAAGGKGHGSKGGKKGSDGSKGGKKGSDSSGPDVIEFPEAEEEEGDSDVMMVTEGGNQRSSPY